MARRRTLAKYKLAEMTGTTTTVKTSPSQQAAEKSVLFGTRDNRKMIIIMSGVGVMLLGLFHYAISPEGELSPAALIFTAIHGGLLGMLLGQLMLVYPDRVMVVFVLMAVLLCESLYVVATGKLDHFEFNVEVLRDMTAIFFWSGWVGFWLGFIMLAKRAKRRRAFQQRFQSAADELPPEVTEGEEPTEGP